MPRSSIPSARLVGACIRIESAFALQANGSSLVRASQRDRASAHCINGASGQTSTHRAAPGTGRDRERFRSRMPQRAPSTMRARTSERPRPVPGADGAAGVPFGLTPMAQTSTHRSVSSPRQAAPGSGRARERFRSRMPQRAPPTMRARTSERSRPVPGADRTERSRIRPESYQANRNLRTLFD